MLLVIYQKVKQLKPPCYQEKKKTKWFLCDTNMKLSDWTFGNWNQRWLCLFVSSRFCRVWITSTLSVKSSTRTSSLRTSCCFLKSSPMYLQQGAAAPPLYSLGKSPTLKAEFRFYWHAAEVHHVFAYRGQSWASVCVNVNALKLCSVILQAKTVNAPGQDINKPDVQFTDMWFLCCFFQIRSRLTHTS